MLVYLHNDVNLLADIWINFRDTAFSYFKIDPTYYVSLPHYGMDVLYKTSGVELDFLKSSQEHDLLVCGIRGGFSGVVRRYAEANNPYMKNYDSDRPISYLYYLDAVNLYGKA